MVEWVSNFEYGSMDRSAGFCVRVLPAQAPPRDAQKTQSSLSFNQHFGLCCALLILMPWFSVGGAFFAWLGAWPICAVMAASLLALIAAFLHLDRHAGDFEQLTLKADRLIVDSHTPDQDQHTEFNSQWVSIAPSDPEAHGLILLGQGRELRFGASMSTTETARVCGELRRRLARIRESGSLDSGGVTDVQTQSKASEGNR